MARKKVTPEDMLGETFGRWKVEGFGRDHDRWLCRCQCGKAKDVHGNSLRMGTSQSCGCKGEDTRVANLERELVGKSWGRLTVLAYAGKHPVQLQNTWLCLCECGEETTLSSYAVINEATWSCGCYQDEMRASYGWTAVIDDKTDKRFGRLVAKEIVGRSKAGQPRWRCECDCGKPDHVVTAGALNSGEVKSCGCLRVDTAKVNFTKHGMSGTPEHRAWKSLMDRCFNDNNVAYPQYGGRGITVCDHWRRAFLNFYEDMGPRPENHSLDRVNVHGNYEKGNCRWADLATQADNRQNTIYLTHAGERLSLSTWARRLDIPKRRIYSRIFLDSWPVAEALTPTANPPPKRRPKEEKRIARLGAVRSVRTAVEACYLDVPNVCENDDCQNEPEEAHHYLGYAEENWLNVRWLCKRCHSREHSAIVEFNGEYKTMSEWADGLGITRVALKARLDSPHWTTEEAMTTPKFGRKAPQVRGKSRMLK